VIENIKYINKDNQTNQLIPVWSESIIYSIQFYKGSIFEIVFTNGNNKDSHYKGIKEIQSHKNLYDPCISVSLYIYMYIYKMFSFFDYHQMYILYIYTHYIH